MKANGCKVDLYDNKPGFTLPSNIGELGDDITELDLRNCSLHGAWYDQTYRARKRIEKRIAQASSRSSSSA